jgi:hypothetical protein
MDHRGHHQSPQHGIGDRELYKAYYFRVIALGKTTEGKPSDVVIGRAA